MLHQLPPLTIGGTVLKESDLVILGVTFDSKITFEKHLRSVSRAASQRLGILRKSWQVFHDRVLLGRCFRGFVLPVLGYCSAVWCSAANRHLKKTSRPSIQWCPDISHRRSMAVVCMLYKIRCNPVHPLNVAVPGPYVPARVTRGALVAHRYTYALPHCRTLQYSRTFIPFLVSLWNDLANILFHGVGLVGFKSRANASLLT